MYWTDARQCVCEAFMVVVMKDLVLIEVCLLVCLWSIQNSVDCCWNEHWVLLTVAARNVYYDIHSNTIGELMKPHLVIYLDVPVPIIQKRIKERNFPHEVNSKVFTQQYLSDMEYFYKQRFLKEIGLVKTFCLYFDCIACCWVQNSEICLIQEIFLSCSWVAQLIWVLLSMPASAGSVGYIFLLQFNLYYFTDISKCWPLAVHLLKILHVIWLSSCLETLGTSHGILSFSSCKEYGVVTENFIVYQK